MREAEIRREQRDPDTRILVFCFYVDVDKSKRISESSSSILSASLGQIYRIWDARSKCMRFMK